MNMNAGVIASQYALFGFYKPGSTNMCCSAFEKPHSQPIDFYSLVFGQREYS